LQRPCGFQIKAEGTLVPRRQPTGRRRPDHIKRCGRAAAQTAPLEEAVLFLAMQPGYTAPATRSGRTGGMVSRTLPGRPTSALDWVVVVTVCALAAIGFAGYGPGTRGPAAPGMQEAQTVDTATLIAGGPLAKVTRGELMVVVVATASQSPSESLAMAEAMESSKRDALSAAYRHLDGKPQHLVSFATRDIIGPSAGLMFSLAIVELFDGEDLARGRRIAGTGTIDRTGTVGPVGQAVEKAVSAERSGADLFLVHASQAGEVAAAVSRIRVVGVRTLAEAVEVLRS
jgi:hypothetical protein